MVARYVATSNGRTKDVSDPAAANRRGYCYFIAVILGRDFISACW